MIKHEGPKRKENPTWTIDSVSSWGEKVGDETLLGRTIALIHESVYPSIPDGTELISIFGERKIKGKDYIDDDIRGGYLAFGILQ